MKCKRCDREEEWPNAQRCKEHRLLDELADEMCGRVDDPHAGAKALETFSRLERGPKGGG